MSIIEHATQVYDAARIQEFKEQGLWPDRLMVDFLDEHARTRGDRTAIVDEMSRCTWRELKEGSDAFASGLIDLGLQPGDFVAIQLPNVRQFSEVYLAVQRAGLRALTIMPIYREHDVAFMLRKCNVRMYVSPDRHRGHDHVEMAGRLLEQIPSLKHVVILGQPGPGMLEYESVKRPAADAATFAARRPDPDELSKVSFTSGTTGRPKGVTHTHNTDIVPPMLTARALGLGPTSPIWMPSPISHATGLLFGVYDNLITGAPLVLQDRWDPGRALELIERERAVFTVSATPFIQGLLDHPDLAHHDVSTLRYFLSGGAPIPSELVQRARDDMGCLLLRVFGSSEAPLHTLNHPEDPWEKVLTTDGRPFEGCEVRITDLGRQSEVPRGDVGEYATRGPHVFLGYYDEPELTAAVFDEDRWYYQGDLCWMDDDDHVVYVDRIKDIINRGGVKISSLEIEELVASHPAVKRCAVVGLPDDRLGERACAVVVLEPGRSLELSDLQRHLEQMRVTKQKWPERLEVVEDFPQTITGKIQKRELVVQIQDASTQGVNA